jgi:hypothetical protein
MSLKITFSAPPFNYELLGEKKDGKTNLNKTLTMKQRFGSECRKTNGLVGEWRIFF